MRVTTQVTQITLTLTEQAAYIPRHSQQDSLSGVTRLSVYWCMNQGAALAIMTFTLMLLHVHIHVNIWEHQ